MADEKVIILDETRGLSYKGRHLRYYALEHNIPYVTNSKDLIKSLKEGR